MGSDQSHLTRLARELAALKPEERTRVIADAERRGLFRLRPPDWHPPKASGGGTWVGGTLRREEIYGDDGR